MKHSRSKNAVLLMIIFICSICLNNVWARETGTMDQLEKENPDDVDKMNKSCFTYVAAFTVTARILMPAVRNNASIRNTATFLNGNFLFMSFICLSMMSDMPI